MKKEEKVNKKRIQINRLLDLINDAEESIEISRKMNSASMVKGHIRLKNELVNELLNLLNKELKIQVKLEKAA